MYRSLLITCQAALCLSQYQVSNNKFSHQNLKVMELSKKDHSASNNHFALREAFITKRMEILWSFTEQATRDQIVSVSFLCYSLNMIYMI